MPLARIIASAASAPAVQPISVAQTAIFSDVVNALVHAGFERTAPNQRSENPGGGKISKLDDVNPIAITINIGSTSMKRIGALNSTRIQLRRISVRLAAWRAA